jgi:hypothetical protein
VALGGGGTEIHTGILCRKTTWKNCAYLVWKSFLKKADGRVWTGLIWIRIGGIGGLL